MARDRWQIAIASEYGNPALTMKLDVGPRPGSSPSHRSLSRPRRSSVTTSRCRRSHACDLRKSSPRRSRGYLGRPRHEMLPT
jgi:hypothetical protein